MKCLQEEKIVSHLFNGLKEDDKKISNIVMNHLNDKSQVFVVCPFIEESENLDIKVAEMYLKNTRTCTQNLM